MNSAASNAVLIGTAALTLDTPEAVLRHQLFSQSLSEDMVFEGQVSDWLAFFRKIQVRTLSGAGFTTA